MSQPKWRLVGNAGDVNPIDHGGLLVFVDDTGVYPPEMEVLMPLDDSDLIEVRRVVMEDCTFIDGVLSDNKFHPDLPAWFAKPESERAERPQDSTYLADLAKFADMDPDELAALFCSPDPMERAIVWSLVGNYHGWDNLDEYPREVTRGRLSSRLSKFKILNPAE